MESKQMHFHCIIIFPFGGLRKKSKGYELFDKLVQLCCDPDRGRSLVVVFDAKSIDAGENREILNGLRPKCRELLRAWSVDTCQGWLTAWGCIFDRDLQGSEANHRIILLPGDLEQVSDETKFFRNLDAFISSQTTDFLIGDFESINRVSSKELIDTYGVYPLTANWFPEAWQAIASLKLKKVRSEFLNINVPTLRRLLKSRAFAYEQTLNMLIVNWSWCLREAKYNIIGAGDLWRQHVGAFDIGTIDDNPDARHYRGAIDQIERTERMLRMLWRELNDWNPNQGIDVFKRLAADYELLDGRSTRIRDAARIAIWAQLSTISN